MPKKRKYPVLLAIKGKIREEGTTYKKVAKEMGIETTTLNNKINGYTEFTTSEIHRLVDILNIPEDMIIKYFFPEMFRNSTKR